MILSNEFDAFYKAARTRLLLQAYALTGDLPAARSAVRDSFVVTWHHWRKVRPLPEPESWVRPLVWSQAQRRATARIWHRDKALEPEAAATHDALGKLNLSQRKALLLERLTDLPSAERARELGVPEPEAERLLRTATEKFVTLRGVREEQIPELFEPLHARVADVTWPRASIIRRAGAARRRTHTLIGAFVAVLLVLATGALVGTTTATDEPTAHGEEPSAASEASPAGPTFDSDRLLSAGALSLLVDGRGWHEVETHDNTEGDGIVTPCQQERFADPEGLAALVRTFETSSGREDPTASAVQTAELSAKRADAHKAWRQALRWYGGCTTPRVQLLSTHTAKRVGDEAKVFQLRRWGGDGSTYLVGVARSGTVTTTTFTSTTDRGEPDLRAITRLLGRAVNGLCTTGEGRCAAPDPKLVQAPPVKVGDVPGMLVEADLPPVEGVSNPWVGSEPHQARENLAATRCDHADFSRKAFRNAVTRTYLIPGADLPAAFGLTQTVGRLSDDGAREFVRTVRQRLATCEDRDLGTDVTPVASWGKGDREVGIWRVTTELDDDSTVTYLMAVLRNGHVVGQVGFVPSGATLPDGAFEALAARALARLDHLPRPRG